MPGDSIDDRFRHPLVLLPGTVTVVRSQFVVSVRTARGSKQAEASSENTTMTAKTAAPGPGSILTRSPSFTIATSAATSADEARQRQLAPTWPSTDENGRILLPVPLDLDAIPDGIRARLCASLSPTEEAAFLRHRSSAVTSTGTASA